ncbi:MAG: hypothetical protein IGR76_16755 [Synechococcales cyanobacterium T60_A2020_003]|nr:hypothetical protein [Synechococcales cyanobacterium T60_A2020_003]
MILIQKIAAGFCLLIGLPIVLLGTVEALNPSTSAEDREGAIAAVVLFGAPPTALGGWLLWNVRHQNRTKQQPIEHAREQLFLKLLQEPEGTITVLRFASEAAIPLAEAQEFLDSKARQLNASFDTTDEGGIIYRFTM